MRRALKIVLGASVAALAAAGAVYSLSPRPLDQPIAFSHRTHVEDLGSDCTDCHLYASTGVRATIPNVETCGVCHMEPLGESEAEMRLAEHVSSDEAIPWVKVYWVPEHVYFSHRRHTAVGEIECQACHGKIGERNEPLVRPLVEITMDSCIECHEKRGASNDCIACHR